MSKSAILLATGLALAVAGGAQAHHSAVMFDHSRVVTVHGTVKTFDFGSPHSWIALIVRQDGKSSAEWDLEGEDTVRLMRDGLARDTLKPGDQITVGVYPLRDGRKVGQLLFITAANGKTYGVNPMPAVPSTPSR